MFALLVDRNYMSGSLLVSAVLPLKIDSSPVVCSEDVCVAYYSVLNLQY